VHKRRVMIVDDEPLMLAAMERFVTIWGWTAIGCSSFEQARTYLNGQAPDALIVDVRLGEYNGLQLVHMARHHDPEMPVVAVSGFDDAVLRHDAERLGAYYLVKPLDFQLLKQLLVAPAIVRG
jgi:DNA-binding response OmpR family regulator